MKNLKSSIKRGEAVNGCWLNLGSSLTAEIIGIAGFDWALIDLEHGAGNEKDALAQLQALQHTNTAAFVRVESAQKQRIQRVLDLGAEGVMCPHISNAEQAKMLVSGLRYPPHGGRGVAKMIRASTFGRNFDDYYHTANDNLVGIVQIETVEALSHLDEIAAVDGVDVLFVGPADLSMALGIFGQYDHRLFKDAVAATVSAANKAGKATGILIFNVDNYNVYYNMGIRVIACGSDGGFVADTSRNVADKINSMRALNEKNTQ
ncbi:MAG: aldolase/citrate lyase family protein [Bacteroidota bacterium]|nr:aldolase/citrate lyase family protein [Bacteroidota bacterium]